MRKENPPRYTPAQLADIVIRLRHAGINDVVEVGGARFFPGLAAGAPGAHPASPDDQNTIRRALGVTGHA